MVTAKRIIDFDGVHCQVILEQPVKSVVLLKISGTDTGEFGDAPMKVLEEWLGDSAPVDLFIDARQVRTASIDVSSEWASWLNENKQLLKSVTMLTGTRFIQITAEFVRRFAGLNGMMWVCTEPTLFDLAVAQAQNR
jgi:hypothetical protein